MFSPEMATDLPQRIKELLGKGLSHSVVASAVGCDPSYISQLLEQEEFSEEIMVLRAKGAEGALARDEKWDEIEKKALEKAADLVNLVSRPSELIKIASMANAAKRTAKEFASDNPSPNQIVQLILPESATIHFQMNSQSQVVEVDGRSMAALPTSRLQEVLKERNVERLETGIVEVQIPTHVLTERKRIETTLDSIGGSDTAVEVVNVLSIASMS